MKQNVNSKASNKGYIFINLFAKTINYSPNYCQKVSVPLTTWVEYTKLKGIPGLATWRDTLIFFYDFGPHYTPSVLVFIIRLWTPAV